MNAVVRPVLALFCALTLLLSLNAQASRGEQKQVLGDYEVHYIGLTSNFLSQKVASAYGINRSGNLGFISLSILKRQPNSEIAVPMAGKVEGTIRNLVGQARPLEFREIKETGAVYYITTFRFDDEDMYHLHFKVQPEGEVRTFDVKYNQRFYKE